MSPSNSSDQRQMPLIFIEGPIQDVVFKQILVHTDKRGWLAEIYRNDELPAEIHPEMAYISETLPGVSRGPHEHAAQTDYFAFIGPGDFTLYLWDIRTMSPTRGNRIKMGVGQSNKQIVIVPPGIVHAYKNVGTVSGWVINQPNKLYAGAGRQDAVDEIRHENLLDSPFVLD
jgi:dTDP-4-dehydrorhamnose 3,5-epimerase-like enzyme